MAQDDDSLDRIEAALERIGRRVEQPDPIEAEVASRLDAVIARLRSGLAEQRPPAYPAEAGTMPAEPGLSDSED